MVPIEPIRANRLTLVHMTPRFITALLAGLRGEAQETAELLLPDGWPDEHDARFLRLRLDQMRTDPASEQWLARAMVSPVTRGMIGHIGFHGPPTEGFGELGYTVFPQHRRMGYATEAATGLMEWARRTHGVRRFRLSISPSNSPSLAMAMKMGFARTGEQMDEEDGLEYIFERDFP